MNPKSHPDLADTLRSLASPAGAPASASTGRSRKPLLWAALLAGVAGAALAYTAWSGQPPGQDVPSQVAAPAAVPAPTTPATVAAQTGAAPAPATLPVAPEVTGSGYVVAPQMVGVYARNSGRVVSLAVDLGDQVTAGQELARLDDQDMGFALESATIARATAALTEQARLIETEQAQSDFSRYEKLRSRGATPQRDLESAQTSLRSARNALARATQDLAKADLALRQARADVDELVIRAPFAGTVTALSVRVGDTVPEEADSVAQGQSMMVIADTADMVIDADVAENSISALKPGQTGEAVLDGFPDHPFPIVLDRISPIASSEKGTLSLRFRISDMPAGIRPNMAARIRVIASDSRQSPSQSQGKP